MKGAIFRSALEGATVEEIEPLKKILGIETTGTTTGLIGASDVDLLWKELSYYGSNNVAYLVRGLEGVDYPEIVRDVCKKIKIEKVTDGDGEESVLANETAILQKLFTDIWEEMSEDERRELLASMNMDEGKARVGGATAMAAVLVGGMGGFGTYQLAVIVANFVARAMLGRGLSLVANAGLTRAIGVVLGPVGWIASGAWLAYDIASPALRKTVPVIVQIAALRQITKQREIYAVMGHGSVGKDALLHHVFGIDTGKIHPIPGTTRDVKLYNAQGDILIPTRVMNFPGFGDLRPEVEQEIEEQAQHCNVIIYLFNGSEIPKREEIEEWERYATVQGRAGRVPVIPVLNKWDKADEDERNAIFNETKKRLNREDVLCVSMKPKPGNSLFEQSVDLIRTRINDIAETRGKARPFHSRARMTG